MMICLFIMFIIFLICLLGRIIFYYLRVNLVVEWVFFRVNRMMVEIYVLLDWVSILFIRFVLMISSMVILYRAEYMKEDINLDRFLGLIVLFVISILIIILSPRLIRILFG